MPLINMSHTGKNAVHVPAMCGKPKKKQPGVWVIVPGKVWNFQSIFGKYTNNLVGKCLE